MDWRGKLQAKIAETLSKPPGDYEILWNSKTPLSYNQVRPMIPPHIDFSLSKRKFWDDISELIYLHAGVVVLTCGLGLLVYLGFWIYEIWRPLYIIRINIRYNKNPLYNV